jgi:MoaA/NifB/PqqE/SkfB family radical SAM enzyme
MLEWKDPYNSFNSYIKGMYYLDWYKSIREWKDGLIKAPKAPVEISLDPFQFCQLKCSHCNASRYLLGDKKPLRIEDDKYLDLIKFFASWGVKGVCFTGETKVKLVNGTHKTFIELEEEWNKNKIPFEVYSRNKKGNIVPGIAKNPRKIKEVAELIELTLDNGKTIKCTLDHQFMLRNGKYKEAKDLTCKDSLMPLYTSIYDGWEQIYDISYRGATHRLFASYWNGNIAKNKQVHHADFNKENNTKNNLMLLTASEHSSIHGKITANKEENKKKFFKNRDLWNESTKGKEHILTQIKKAQAVALKYWRSPKGKKHNAEKIIKYNKSELGRKNSGKIFSNFNASKEGKKNSLLQLEKINSNLEIRKKSLFNRAIKVFNILEEKGLDKTEENYSKFWVHGLPKYQRAKENVFNHKIISKKIIKLETPVSVYCLEVEKYHNFALSAGVFVKNCHGGGGEPTLYTGLWKGLELATSLGLENSIATNGINFNDETIDIAVKNCRWIGVSVDSATKETYMEGRGVNCFDKTIENLRKLSLRAKELNTGCDVSMKFLLFQYNQHEVFEACKLAKELGVRDFHVRPADLSHINMHEQYKEKTNPYNLESIEKQFEQCHEIETKDFRVFTAVHKFDKNFMPIKYFEQCYASPCCLQICPDGNCYLCPDQRYQEFYKLGSWNPNPEAILEFWGSQKHYDLVFKHGKKACNTRCTFNPYNTMCERLAINDNDPVCWKFI